jgi:glutathione peroxidase
VITIIFAAMLFSLLNLSSFLVNRTDQAAEPLTERSVLDFTMTSIDDEPVPLSKYRSKVLLIVNVASYCGNTKQYASLEKLYTTYHDSGLEILAFPANNFGSQEPGTNEEIKQFCSTKYGVSFPLFSKISVRGDDQHPLYRFLTSESTNPRFPGSVKWNFQKYLISRDGEIIGKFAPGKDPLSPDIVSAIDDALKQKASSEQH